MFGNNESKTITWFGSVNLETGFLISCIETETGNMIYWFETAYADLCALLPIIEPLALWKSSHQEDL